jgi:hypothetical protein
VGLFGPAWLPSNTSAISNTRVPVGFPRDVDVDHRALIYVFLHVSSSFDDRSRREFGACRLSTICFALRRSTDLRLLLLIEADQLMVCMLRSIPSPNYGRSHDGLVSADLRGRDPRLCPSSQAVLAQPLGTAGRRSKGLSSLRCCFQPSPPFSIFSPSCLCFFFFCRLALAATFFLFFRLCSASSLTTPLFFFFFLFELTSSNLQCVFFLSPQALHSPMWWSRNRSLIL